MIAVVYINVITRPLSMQTECCTAQAWQCYLDVKFMNVQIEMVDCCHMTSGGPIFSTGISWQAQILQCLWCLQITQWITDRYGDTLQCIGLTGAYWTSGLMDYRTKGLTD